MGAGVKIIDLIINELQKSGKNVLRLLKLAVYLYRYQLNINKNDKMTHTLESLANYFGSKVWKESRVYLPQFGYKTKKMNTTTYVYIQDGKVQVSVFVECPSQPYQWLQKEKQRVIEQVLEEIKYMEEKAGQTETTYGTGHNEVIIEKNTPPMLVAEKMEADSDLVK